jgi:hypothetical protein
VLLLVSEEPMGVGVAALSSFKLAFVFGRRYD